MNSLFSNVLKFVCVIIVAWCSWEQAIQNSKLICLYILPNGGLGIGELILAKHARDSGSQIQHAMIQGIIATTGIHLEWYQSKYELAG